MGVKQPPMLATRKIKKTIVCTLRFRHALARIIGRIINMAAPVVPIQLANTVPISKRMTLFLVVPAMLPLILMPPATIKRPKRRTMKGT